MLACRVICCSHQLDHCIWVYISHQSDFHIRVCILHQSNCLIRVCISHQSYYSIWISYANYSIWVLFLRKWCHWIRGLYTKNDIIQKFWVHLISIMVCGLRKSLLDWGWDLSGCERLTFNLFVEFLSGNMFFPHLPNNLYSITYHENNIQSPIRTYPIIYYSRLLYNFG